jgi:hypothetical protein
MIPTPKTDAEIKDHSDDIGWCLDDFEGVVDASFARELERENAELRQALSGRTVSCSQCNDAAAKMEAMREAIKFADEALEADGYDLENKARAKLQSFITPCSTEPS